jgi:hypothetical protein
MNRFVDTDSSAFDFNPSPAVSPFQKTSAESPAEMADSAAEWASLSDNEKSDALVSFQLHAGTQWYDYLQSKSLTLNADVKDLLVLHGVMKAYKNDTE